MIRKCSKVGSANLKTLTMATRLCTIEHIVARIAIRQSTIMTQRWQTTVKGKNATLDYKKMMIVRSSRGAGRPTTVITEVVKAAATEAFHRSPKNSIRSY